MMMLRALALTSPQGCQPLIYFIPAIGIAWHYSDKAKATGKKKRRAYQAALLGFLAAGIAHAAVAFTMVVSSQDLAYYAHFLGLVAGVGAGLATQIGLSKRWIPNPPAIGDTTDQENRG